MSRTKAIVSGRSDAELISSSRAGDVDAYAELYNRHIEGARAAARALSRSRADTDDIVAEAFSRVLGALRRGGGPDVSFRPYLLTAVRNSFYDRARRAKREEVTDEPDDIVSLTALDAANSGEDRAMVAAAFASLPERWQLVLWHTEVEGMTPAEVAPLVGLAPNAASALAYRAREGLRQAYLQAHLKQNIPAECSECAPKLGAYVRDGLAARERRRVDDHLAHCDSCAGLLAELNEANGHLKAVLVPLFVGVPAAQYLAGLHGAHGIMSLLHNVARPHQFVGGAVAAATVAAITLSVVTLRSPDNAASAGQRPTNAQIANGGTTAGTEAGSTPAESDQTGVEEVSDAEQAVAVEADGQASATTIDDGAVLDASITAPEDPSDAVVAGEPSSDDAVPAIADPGTGAEPSGSSPSTVDSIPQDDIAPADTTPTTEPKPTPTSSTVLVAQQPPPIPTTLPIPTTPTTPTTVKPVVTPTPTTVKPVVTPTPTPVPAPQITPGFSMLVSGGDYAGGSLGLALSVRNAAANDTITGPTVRIPIPAGFNFDTTKGTGSWKCKGSTVLVCDLPSMSPGGVAQATVYLHVGPATKGEVGFSATFSSDTTPSATTTAGAFISTGIYAADLVYDDTDRGSVEAIGNSNLTCDPAEAGCAEARAGESGGTQLNRQSFSMTNVNDSAQPNGEINSSSANLDLAATASVRKAFLLWSADTTAGGATAPDPSARGRVRITDPKGTPTEVVAEASSYGDGSRYSALQDVTELVGQGGAGTYQVANVQAAAGLGGFGGWSLIVVTHDETDPVRAIAVIAPEANVGPAAGFDTLVRVPILQPTRDITVAAVGFEGEGGFKPDSLTLNGEQLTNDANPQDNQFNSSAEGGIDSAVVNTFGVDVDVYDSAVTGPGLNFQATSANETFRVAAIAFAVDIFE